MMLICPSPNALRHFSGGKTPCIIGKADFTLLGYRRHCQTRPFELRILLLKLKPIRLELIQHTVKGWKSSTA